MTILLSILSHPSYCLSWSILASQCILQAVWLQSWSFSPALAQVTEINLNRGVCQRMRLMISDSSIFCLCCIVSPNSYLLGGIAEIGFNFCGRDYDYAIVKGFKFKTYKICMSMLSHIFLTFNVCTTETSIQILCLFLYCFTALYFLQLEVRWERGL